MNTNQTRIRSKERRQSERFLTVRAVVLGMAFAVVLAVTMYQTVCRQGYKEIEATAMSEASLIVEITNGFVNTYADYTARHAADVLPASATFRADVLEHLEQASSDAHPIYMGVIGQSGSPVSVIATDDTLREQLAELGGSSVRQANDRVIIRNGKAVHRSLWAVTAQEQARADYRAWLPDLSANERHESSDLVGAQVIEQNIQPQLDNLERNAIVQAVLLFTVALASWLYTLYLISHFRRARELKQLATTDPLTGCINRRELYDRVEELQGLVNGALLMLDLDRFKQINDTHGHDAGDEVIRDFASRVKGTLRNGDWVARVGGEEFVVWLPNVKPADAKRVAERIRNTAEQSQVEVDGVTLHYTVSIGLKLLINARPGLFDSWMKAADKLLYRAKQQGRNRVVCESDLV